MLSIISKLHSMLRYEVLRKKIQQGKDPEFLGGVAGHV